MENIDEYIKIINGKLSEEDLVKMFNFFDKVAKLKEENEFLKRELDKRIAEEKVCCSELPQRHKDELVAKTYELVRRMSFENEKRIWEERAKEVDDEIKELTRRKEACAMELKEVSDRYYREY